MARGRGRLSSFDLLPAEADSIVIWAAETLSDRGRTQTDIYAEFVTRCEALMAEHRGELDFDIPAFSSFNRFSVRQAKLSRRLDTTRDIVRAISGNFDAKESDDLAIMTAETIKSLVLTMLADADEEKIDTKSVLELAGAFRQAQTAQNVSADRRRKAEAEFQAKVTEAVDTVAKAKGMTAETSEAIKAQILGVKA